MKNDSKASVMMNLSITPGQFHHIKRATISKQAWDILKDIHESRGPVRKTILFKLFKQLLRMKMKTNITMTQHVTEFITKAEQIAEAGIVIQDDLLSIMLSSSLPTEYENFIVAMESRDVLPPLKSLKHKLIEKEERQSDWSAKSNADNNVLLLLRIVPIENKPRQTAVKK